MHLSLYKPGRGGLRKNTLTFISSVIRTLAELVRSSILSLAEEDFPVGTARPNATRIKEQK